MDITVQLKPVIEKERRVILSLNKIDEAVKCSFRAPARDGDVSTIKFPIDVDLKAGFYFVRVNVDGFESPLQQDKNTGAFIGPKIEIKPKPPVVKELISTNITLTASTGDPVTVTGKVTVKDQNGAAVDGARVAITWNSTDTQPPDQRMDARDTQNGGVATFAFTLPRPNRKVTYRLVVNAISKTGYNFDPNKSPAREGTVDILPAPAPGAKLISQDIKLYAKANEQENVTAVGALIFVADENNTIVTEASVEAELTFNNDPPKKIAQLTHLDDGIAWFDNLGTHAGDYKLKVVKIEKDAGVFDGSLGMTESQHTFPSTVIYPRFISARLEAGQIIADVPVDTADGRIVRGVYVVVRLDILRPNDEWQPVSFHKELTAANGRAKFRIRPAIAGTYRLGVSSFYSDGHTVVPSRVAVSSDPIEFPG